MSDDLNAIGLIAAVVIPGFAVFIFADRWIHDRGEVIVTGLVRGVPVTTKHRWLVLFNNWFPLVYSLILFGLLASAIFVAIAQNVTDPFVQTLAYGCAFGFTGIPVVWIFLGGSWLLHYWGILRQAEAD